MTDWLIETLVATTALMVLVLILRPTVSARFGARAAYLLWAAPALRMILPPLPSAWAPPEFAPMRDAVAIVAASTQPVATAASEGGVAWAPLLIAVWLGGAACFFAAHWLAYLCFSRRLAAGKSGGIAEGIAITQSAAIAAPLALGLLVRRIVVPVDFARRYTAEEQRLALAHELVHHRRCDMAANLLALAMLALHWWNPIAHLAHRAFRRDQEAACDAIVLTGATPAERYAYGSALLKSATSRVPIAVCPMAAATLKARLRQIADTHGKPRVKSGLAVAALAVFGGVALTASVAALVPHLPQPSKLRVMVAVAPVAPQPTKITTAPVGHVMSTTLVRRPVPAQAPPADPHLPPAPEMAALAHPVALACPAGSGTAAFAIRVSHQSDGASEARGLLLCRHTGAERTEMIAALSVARETIAVESGLDGDQREQALAAIDRQITELTARPLPTITLQ